MSERKIHLFERPVIPGWVYPCTLEEIESRLARLPGEDLDGLWAVGLVPSTRKDDSADGRYYQGDRPAIHLYSFPATFRFKLKAHTTPGQIEQCLAMQL